MEIILKDTSKADDELKTVSGLISVLIYLTFLLGSLLSAHLF
jgi:hypothetical protein